MTHVGNDPRGQGGIASVIRASLAIQTLDAQHLSSHIDGARFLSPRRFVSAAWALATSSRRQLGVVHVHVAYRGSILREGALLVLSRIRRLPTVVTLHGSSIVPFMQRHRTLCKWVLAASDEIITLGDKAADEVRTRLGMGNVWVIPNFVEVPPDTGPSAGWQVVFGGSVGHRKGADVLAAAFARLSEEFPAATLAVAGPSEPGYTWPFESPSVKLLGPLEHSELLNILGSARIAVLPSRAEAMPMFILEAMAHSCAVIATDVGEIAAAFGEVAMIIEPGSITALETALRQLLSDRDLTDTLARKARNLCVERYSTSHAQDVFRAVYESASRRRVEAP